jgi:hypothetical protein
MMSRVGFSQPPGEKKKNIPPNLSILNSHRRRRRWSNLAPNSLLIENSVWVEVIRLFSPRVLFLRRPWSFLVNGLRTNAACCPIFVVCRPARRKRILILFFWLEIIEIAIFFSPRFSLRWTLWVMSVTVGWCDRSATHRMWLWADPVERTPFFHVHSRRVSFPRNSTWKMSDM